MWVEIIVCIFAGLGAGIGTGFAGMSAAAVISPMLIVFLGVSPYEAVGISLASDVLASAVSAAIYGKHKNIDIKNGWIMMAAVLAFTLLCSWLSSLLPSAALGNFSIFATILVGLKFIIKPVMTTKDTMKVVSPKKRVVQSLLCGAVVGCFCGFVGAGGGMIMLLLLTGVLGYDLKTAVGTSVFIMAFTALTGSVSHFVIGGVTKVVCLAVCMLSTLLFAQIAARFANKASPILLSRLTGILLTVLGTVIIVVQFAVG